MMGPKEEKERYPVWLVYLVACLIAQVRSALGHVAKKDDTVEHRRHHLFFSVCLLDGSWKKAALGTGGV